MVYLRAYWTRRRDEADAQNGAAEIPTSHEFPKLINHDDWLNSLFTMFTDRASKYQLPLLGRTGFEPSPGPVSLCSPKHITCSSGRGLGRVVRRTAQLMKEGDVREAVFHEYHKSTSTSGSVIRSICLAAKLVLTPRTFSPQV